MIAARRMLLAALLGLGVGLPGIGLAAGEPVTVFAAASLRTALDAVAARFTAATARPVRLVYGGSSVLARQIRQGAPAQVFLSANSAWMDALERDGFLAAATRVDLLTNRLVLVAAPGRTSAPAIAPGFDLAGALGDGRLAMALVDAVPAGIYGKAALRSLGVWDRVRDRVAQADNVRAALWLVASGEAPFGIVYATDAAAEPRVRVVGRFPADSHPPILYPAAILSAGDSGEARDFLRFLTGAEAGALFAGYGFGLAGGGG